MSVMVSDYTEEPEVVFSNFRKAMVESNLSLGAAMEIEATVQEEALRGWPEEGLELDTPGRSNFQVAVIDGHLDGPEIGNEQASEQEPAAGMVFDTLNGAVQYYKAYGKRMGFGVSIRNSILTPRGTYHRLRLACTREGNPRSKNPRKCSIYASQKAGCKASMSLVRSEEDDGKYVVTKVHLQHSHETSPSKGRHFRCNRRLSLGVRRTLEINDSAGIRVCHNYTSLVQEYGGYESMGLNERDCRNYIDQQRRMRICEGDGEAVRRYFEVMKFQSPNFFSRIEVDEARRVSNLFWADGRTRSTYEYFNDVVAFDTTYLTNRYDMPFAPFCGVNHHGQTIMLGCGLIANETVEAFVWLFSTWLQCMGGVQPKAIITDQCKAIRKAVELVFPTTRHRWCIWHIRQKFPQKLGATRAYRELEKHFSRLIYECNDRTEFEEKWNEMVEANGVADNDWLLQLYAEREMWAPAYLADTFWAGMSSTQRSEGLNAFFNGFVNGQTSLKTFVEQYALAQRRKVEKEAEADFQSYNTVVQCVTKLDYEKQFQAAYTQSKFIEIQGQLKEMLGIFPEQIGEDGVQTLHRCEEGSGRIEIVRLNQEKTEYECTCKRFEFRGIVCTHGFAVLLQQRVKWVNEKYIMERWRKDIRRRYNYEKMVTVVQEKRPEMLRYEELRQLMLEVAEIGSETADMTMQVKKWGTNLLDKLTTWNEERGNQMKQSKNVVAITGQNETHEVAKERKGPEKVGTEGLVCTTYELPVLNPTRKKRRGRPRKQRQKSVVERLVRTRKRKKRNDGNGDSASTEKAGNEAFLGSPSAGQDGTVGKGAKPCIEEKRFASLAEVLDNSTAVMFEKPLKGAHSLIEAASRGYCEEALKTVSMQQSHDNHTGTDGGGNNDIGQTLGNSCGGLVRRSKRLAIQMPSKP